MESLLASFFNLKEPSKNNKEVYRKNQRVSEYFSNVSDSKNNEPFQYVNLAQLLCFFENKHKSYFNPI